MDVSGLLLQTREMQPETTCLSPVLVDSSLRCFFIHKRWGWWRKVRVRGVADPGRQW